MPDRRADRDLCLGLLCGDLVPFPSDIPAQPDAVPIELIVQRAPVHAQKHLLRLAVIDVIDRLFPVRRLLDRAVVADGLCSSDVRSSPQKSCR